MLPTLQWQRLFSLILMVMITLSTATEESVNQSHSHPSNDSAPVSDFSDTMMHVCPNTKKSDEQGGPTASSRSWTPDYEPPPPVVVQDCPSGRPVSCASFDCLGSKFSATPYRCLSTMAFTNKNNNIATTLLGCPCCPKVRPNCIDEECGGGVLSVECPSELLKGCQCITESQRLNEC